MSLQSAFDLRTEEEYSEKDFLSQLEAIAGGQYIPASWIEKHNLIRPTKPEATVEYVTQLLAGRRVMLHPESEKDCITFQWAYPQASKVLSEESYRAAYAELRQVCFENGRRDPLDRNLVSVFQVQHPSLEKPVTVSLKPKDFGDATHIQLRCESFAWGTGYTNGWKHLEFDVMDGVMAFIDHVLVEHAPKRKVKA